MASGIIDALAAADGGRASLVVGGDAGVGKTRLLAEFAAGLDAASERRPGQTRCAVGRSGMEPELLAY